MSLIVDQPKFRQALYRFEEEDLFPLAGKVKVIHKSAGYSHLKLLAAEPALSSLPAEAAVPAAILVPELHLGTQSRFRSCTASPTATDRTVIPLPRPVTTHVPMNTASAPATRPIRA